MWYLIVWLVFLLGLMASQSMIKEREKKAVDALNAWCCKFAQYFTAIPKGAGYLSMNDKTLNILSDYFPIRPKAWGIKYEIAYKKNITFGIYIDDYVPTLDIICKSSVFSFDKDNHLERGVFQKQQIYVALDIEEFRYNFSMLKRACGLDYKNGGKR